MSDGKQQLSLLVLNSEQLEGNSQVQHQFGVEGGSLGSADRDSWRLRERLGAVLPEHARIEWVDGRFCLCDVSGQTFINGATSPIGRQRKVALVQGDELLIGPFRIRIFTDGVQAEPQLDQILGNRRGDEMDEWFEGDMNGFSAPVEDRPHTDKHSDPLWALNQERNSAAAILSGASNIDSMLPQLNSFTGMKDTMSQEFIELPDVQSFDGALNGGVSLSSLMHGLGQTLPCDGGPQTQEMLREMGKTLRAMVEGLLTLQAEQAALADKLLRPIEDNPLRLGLGYDETLSLLFADSKSPVHLSAPAAVAEVLRNIRIHHIANQQAIQTALHSMLQAFSPEVLLQRFSHYRRGAEDDALDNGWAWNMYQHYFNELTSSRQQGFHKLFQQVYAQAYDRAVRENQESR
ncbi:FHA domain protein [Enterobacter sp. BIGb0383]|uniref:type VI secretion system-associated FHA domain protein TagH n=1 Tax=unclassified Enterobacter TaxID=2608935 RepID=UPI000F467218|nr:MULTISPECIES: type VI secretion system-associated FHA domain protein TagH [unclassified Enterobacter]ROP58151.1 FHA domain protein [Enterobacter sp. BIGb0383]ROS06961.1 FHA domain protein [Enterobacter sp. BIGb0359]